MKIYGKLLFWITICVSMVAISGEVFGQIALNTIAVNKQVCTDIEGKNQCSVIVEWSGGGSYSAPYCVFIKSSKQLWSCSPNVGRAEYPFVTMTSETLELRSGSYSYSDSKLIKDIVLAGVESRAATNIKKIEPVKKDYLKKFQYSFSGASWDGKLYFGPNYFIHTNYDGFRDEIPRYGLSVRVLRQKNLKKDNSGKINFGYSQAQDQKQQVAQGITPNSGCIDKNNDGYITDEECYDSNLDKRIFSDNYLIDSPDLTSDQISLIPENRVKEIKNFSSRVGVNQLSIESPIYIAVFPHPSVKDNPYRSNLNGNPSNTESYAAYRLYAISASHKIGGVQSKYPPFATDRPYYFLGKYELIVVVKDPDTNHATIANVRIITPAKPLYDASGSLLYGYEMGVSLDGQMIVYSGNPLAGKLPGRGGQVVYSYTQNAFLDNAWTVPKHLTAMYSTDGPGRSVGETLVNNVPFSKRFPIAKLPIKDYLGNVYPADVPLAGSYVWLGFDASEAVFSTVPSYFGASRHGTVMVGRRTNGTIYNIDGDMNLTRGNPTDNYSIYSGAESDALKSAYQNLPAPNFNFESIGAKGSDQVLLSAVALFGTSWDPFKGDNDPLLPLSRKEKSYGFIVSDSGRYAEAEILDNRKDVLLYYPMNEPVKHDPAVTKNYYDQKISAEEFRKNGVKFISNQTADYSDFHQVGNMVGDAYYPFEFHDVKGQWSTSKILKDIQEGAYGNSIYFRRSGGVTTTLNSGAYSKIAQSKEFNFSFWVKKSSNSTGPVFNLQGFLSLWINGGNLDFTFFNKSYPSGTRVVSYDVFPIGSWSHVSIDYKLGRFKIYVNGEKVDDVFVKGDLLDVSGFPGGLKLFLGPNGNLNGEDFIQMDEVYIHSTSLSKEEVINLVGNKLITTEKSNINIPSYASKLSQEFVSIDSTKDASIRQLGEDLFNSTGLSINNSISCSNCHKAMYAFGDNLKLSIGVNGFTSRNTPALVNELFSSSFFLDGRSDSIEEQVLHPILNNTEMGFANLPALISRLRNDALINGKFKSAFGRDANQTDLAIALGRYIRGLVPQNSAFDSGQLSGSAQKGKDIFYGFGNCVACHSGSNFTDGKFHNVGVSLDVNSLLENGRARISKRYSDVGAFKTPSLRSVAKTAPYFHDGRFATLSEVIDHYSSGGDGDEYQSSEIRPLLLNSTQKQNLLDFLSSLSSNISEN